MIKNDFFLSNFPIHQAFRELGEVAVRDFLKILENYPAKTV